MRFTLLTSVLALSLSQVSAQEERLNPIQLGTPTQAELVQMVVETPTFTHGIITSNGLFGKTEAYETWAVKAAGALKALAEEETLEEAVKADLIQSISLVDTREEKPFKTLRKRNVAQVYEKILWNSEWVRPIGPVASVLAKHKVNEAVPFLVERYFDQETYSQNKAEIFYALISFNDVRAMPVFDDYIRRVIGKVDADWDVIAIDVIPTILKAADSEDNRIHNDAVTLISDLKRKNPDPTVQKALRGEMAPRNENRIAFVITGNNGRAKRVELPVDTDFQPKTEQDLAVKSALIVDGQRAHAELSQSHTALTGSVDQNRKDFDKNATEVKQVLTNQGQAIKDVTAAQAKTAGDVLVLDASLKTTDAKVAGIDTKVGAIDSRVQEAEKALNSMKSFMADKQKSDANFEQNFGGLKKQVADLEAQLNALRAKFAPTPTTSEGEKSLIDNANKTGNKF